LFCNSRKCCGAAGPILKKEKEGTAVGFLWLWCGRSATTLVAAGHSLTNFGASMR